MAVWPEALWFSAKPPEPVRDGSGSPRSTLLRVEFVEAPAFVFVPPLALPTEMGVGCGRGEERKAGGRSASVKQVPQEDAGERHRSFHLWRGA